MVLQFLEVCRIGLLFPFFSICYIVCPWASFSQKLRKPFIKFICSSSSYFTFLCKYVVSYFLLYIVKIFLIIKQDKNKSFYQGSLLNALYFYTFFHLSFCLLTLQVSKFSYLDSTAKSNGCKL